MSGEVWGRERVTEMEEGSRLLLERYGRRGYREGWRKEEGTGMCGGRRGYKDGSFG